MSDSLQEDAPEKLGLRVVAVTLVVLVVLLGLYWGGRRLLLAPSGEEQTIPKDRLTAPLTPCEDPTVYRSVADALAADEPCTLDLSNQQLGELPENIGALTSLRTLNVSNNQLRQLPGQLGKLKRLQKLDASNNSLAEFPKLVAFWEYIEVLDLSENSISRVPPTIGVAGRLAEFYIYNNEVIFIAEHIGWLNTLEVLDVRDNQLRSLPARVDRLFGLERLAVGGNPLPIGEVRRLQRLFSDDELSL